MRRWPAVVTGAVVLALAPCTAAASPPGTSVPGPVDESGGVTDGDTGVAEGGDPGGTPAPPLTLPLVPVPSGCEAPPPAHVVFLGTVVDRDYRTIRYRIDQVKWGRPAPFAADRVGDTVIDVRYGLDVQYLVDGEQYLVGAVVDPALGLLVSRVTDKIEDFGGDEVIGVSETDADCPVLEPADRTLHPDGTVVEGSMLAPFFEAKWRIAGSVLLPLGAACGALFALSALRLTITGAVRGAFGRR